MIRDYDNITPGERTGADFGLLVLRFATGLFFLIAGIKKVSGGTGNFVKFASDFLPGFMPAAIGKGYLYAGPWLEILVGLGIMLGLLSALSALGFGVEFGATNRQPREREQRRHRPGRPR